MPFLPCLKAGISWQESDEGWIGDEGEEQPDTRPRWVKERWNLDDSAIPSVVQPELPIESKLQKKGGKVKARRAKTLFTS